MKTLDRMEKGQEKVVVLLEKVANQDARIGNLETNSEKNYKSLNELFTRVREIEVLQATDTPEIRARKEGAMEELSRKLESLNHRLEKVLHSYKFVTSKYFQWTCIALIAMTVVGFGFDLYSHIDSIKAIWHFWKMGS